MYDEVKVRREVSGEMREPVGEITEEVTLSVSVHSTSTGSSMLSDNSTADPRSSGGGGQSEPANQHGSYPRRHGNDDFAAHRNRVDHRGDRGNPRNYDACVGNQEVDMTELEAILRGVDRDSPSKGGMVDVHHVSHGGPIVGLTHSTEMSSGTWTDKKENNTALNAVSQHNILLSIAPPSQVCFCLLVMYISPSLPLSLPPSSLSLPPAGSSVGTAWRGVSGWRPGVWRAWGGWSG